MILENRDEIQLLLNDGRIYDANKASVYFGKLRNVYYDKVCTDFLEYLRQNVEPEINDRALYAIENPSVCGLEGRKPDDICMAGDLYAICYWAVTNEVGNEEEYKKITDIQNEILDETLQEALKILQGDE